MIGINFKNGLQNSIYIITDEKHKQELIQATEEYIEELKEDQETIEGTPLGNGDVETIILDFITWYFEGSEGISDTYRLSQNPPVDTQTMDIKTKNWTPPERP